MSARLLVMATMVVMMIVMMAMLSRLVFLVIVCSGSVRRFDCRGFSDVLRSNRGLRRDKTNTEKRHGSMGLQYEDKKASWSMVDELVDELDTRWGRGFVLELVS
jgi:hypothetical protein